MERKVILTDIDLPKEYKQDLGVDRALIYDIKNDLSFSTKNFKLEQIKSGNVNFDKKMGKMIDLLNVYFNCINNDCYKNTKNKDYFSMTDTTYISSINDRYSYKITEKDMGNILSYNYLNKVKYDLNLDNSLSDDRYINTRPLPSYDRYVADLSKSIDALRDAKFQISEPKSLDVAQAIIDYYRETNPDLFVYIEEQDDVDVTVDSPETNAPTIPAPPNPNEETLPVQNPQVDVIDLTDDTSVTPVSEPPPLPTDLARSIIDYYADKRPHLIPLITDQTETGVEVSIDSNETNAPTIPPPSNIPDNAMASTGGGSKVNIIDTIINDYKTINPDLSYIDINEKEGDNVDTPDTRSPTIPAPATNDNKAGTIVDNAKNGYNNNPAIIGEKGKISNDKMRDIINGIIYDYNKNPVVVDNNDSKADNIANDAINDYIKNPVVIGTNYDKEKMKDLLDEIGKKYGGFPINFYPPVKGNDVVFYPPDTEDQGKPETSDGKVNGEINATDGKPVDTKLPGNSPPKEGTDNINTPVPGKSPIKLDPSIIANIIVGGIAIAVITATLVTVGPEAAVVVGISTIIAGGVKDAGATEIGNKVKPNTGVDTGFDRGNRDVVGIDRGVLIPENPRSDFGGETAVIDRNGNIDVSTSGGDIKDSVNDAKSDVGGVGEVGGIGGVGGGRENRDTIGAGVPSSVDGGRQLNGGETIGFCIGIEVINDDGTVSDLGGACDVNDANGNSVGYISVDRSDDIGKVNNNSNNDAKGSTSDGKDGSGGNGGNGGNGDGKDNSGGGSGDSKDENKDTRPNPEGTGGGGTQGYSNPEDGGSGDYNVWDPSRPNGGNKKQKEYNGGKKNNGGGGMTKDEYDAWLKRLKPRFPEPDDYYREVFNTTYIVQSASLSQGTVFLKKNTLSVKKAVCLLNAFIKSEIMSEYKTRNKIYDNSFKYCFIHNLQLFKPFNENIPTIRNSISIPYNVQRTSTGQPILVKENILVRNQFTRQIEPLTLLKPLTQPIITDTVRKDNNKCKNIFKSILSSNYFTYTLGLITGILAYSMY